MLKRIFKKSNKKTLRPLTEPEDFLEKLREEEEALKAKYKTPKENLCFTFTKGDLFSAPSDASLAHCVSEDFRMGKGIAIEFKKRFEGVNELLSQSKIIFCLPYITLDFH
jgi:hypothetical protein